MLDVNYVNMRCMCVCVNPIFKYLWYHSKSSKGEFANIFIGQCNAPKYDIIWSENSDVIDRNLPEILMFKECSKRVWQVSDCWGNNYLSIYFSINISMILTWHHSKDSWGTEQPTDRKAAGEQQRQLRPRTGQSGRSSKQDKVIVR